MRNIFHEKSIEKNFKLKGYTILDFLSNEKFNQLDELYKSIKGDEKTSGTNKNTYELSFFEKNIDGKKLQFEKIYGFLKPIINEVLLDYVPIMVNLFSKEKNLGEVPIHQNWTFVDEDLFTSVSLWIPLQDVSKSNGTLEIIPGSHKVICKYRGPSIPWVFDDLNEIMKEKYMVPMEIKKGQAVILDDSVIHYSGINNLETPRKAIQVILRPRDSKLIHCHKIENNLIEVMNVNDDYFFDFDMWEKPKPGINQKNIKINLEKINESILVERCYQNICKNL